MKLNKFHISFGWRPYISNYPILPTCMNYTITQEFPCIWYNLWCNSIISRPLKYLTKFVRYCDYTVLVR